MAFGHHKWEKSGRTFSDPETNRYKYEAVISEQQTWDGLKWLPYLWKATSNELQYGHNLNNIEFASDKQILKAAGKIICSSMKFFVQAYIGGQWVNQPHGIPTKNIADNYPTEGRSTGYLDFPDAHLSFGAQSPYDLKTGLEVGRSEQSVFGFRFRAPVTGQVRFQAVLDGLEKLPTDWEWIWATFDPLKGKEDRKVGIRVKDLTWKWTYDEAPFRDIDVETNPDETKKVTITFGPYDYTANEWLTVYPDTWGPTAITDTNNDCDEKNGTVELSGKDSDGDAVGQLTVIFKIGWRWDNVAVPVGSTIENGCKVTAYQTYAEANQPTTEIQGVDEADPLDWNSGTKPSARSKVAATVPWTPSDNDNQDQDTPELKEIIDDIVNGGSFVEDNALALVVDDNSAPNGYMIQFEDVATGGGSNTARLTIVYTAAGGAVAPTSVFYGPFVGPMGGPI